MIYFNDKGYKPDIDLIVKVRCYFYVLIIRTSRQASWSNIWEYFIL